MTNLPPSYGDLPATNDELGFTPAASALAEIVQDALLADTPLTVGVYGEWGSGKTSLMRMILKDLDHNCCTTVWFDAWRYAQQDALWRALLLSVVEALRTLIDHDDAWLHTYIDHQNRLKPTEPPTALDSAGLAATRTALTARLDDLTTSLYRSVDRDEPGEIQFQWEAAGKLAAGAIIRAGLSFIPMLGQISQPDHAASLVELFQRERTRIYRQQVQSLEQFHYGLRDLVNQLLSALDRRLVVFIDDLDRCLPEQAIGVLEAIKVFLDIPGCIFVLGIDRDIIERGIRVRYKEFALSGSVPTGPFPVAERDYLEKIVQVPFRLPPLAPQAIHRFLMSRLPSVPGLSHDEPAQVAALMTTGLRRNPRKVKRSLNIFRLQVLLNRAQGRATPAGLIAKLTVIQSSFPDLYEKIASEPTLLRNIEAIARGITLPTPIPQEQRDEMGKHDPRLREMLNQDPWYENMSDDDLRTLVYQSQVTVDGSGGE
jgi:hypothetical protein